MKKTLTLHFTEIEPGHAGELRYTPTTCKVQLEGDESLIKRITHALEVI